MLIVQLLRSISSCVEVALHFERSHSCENDRLFKGISLFSERLGLLRDHLRLMVDLYLLHARIDSWFISIIFLIVNLLNDIDALFNACILLRDRGSWVALWWP